MKNGIDTGTLICTAKNGVKIIDGVRIEVPAGRAGALPAELNPHAKFNVFYIVSTIFASKI